MAWSHFGGTWGLPGGALHEGESAVAGAIREAQEEAGVPDGAVRPRFTSVLDLHIWAYTTVVADVLEPFEPVITDPESIALEWVPVGDVAKRPLHPGFEKAWPELRELLAVRPVLVVDGANVVGSVPNCWWRDRAGAAANLRDRLENLQRVGISAHSLVVAATRWFPELALVLEGQASDVEQTSDAVRIVSAQNSGDDAIVTEAESLHQLGRHVTVITSDRELQRRVEATGASVRGVRRLLDELDA